jgi:hypothetical protein
VRSDGPDGECWQQDGPPSSPHSPGPDSPICALTRPRKGCVITCTSCDSRILRCPPASASWCVVAHGDAQPQLPRVIGTAARPRQIGGSRGQGGCDHRPRGAHATRLAHRHGDARPERSGGTRAGERRRARPRHRPVSRVDGAGARWEVGTRSAAVVALVHALTLTAIHGVAEPAALVPLVCRRLPSPKMPPSKRNPTADRWCSTRRRRSGPRR